MPVSKERENRLKYGYGERSQLLVLDLKVRDEVVPDLEYLSDQPKKLLQNPKQGGHQKVEMHQTKA